MFGNSGFFSLSQTNLRSLFGLFANFIVAIVSSMLSFDGEMFAIMAILEPSVKESYRNLVNLDSLNRG